MLKETDSGDGSPWLSRAFRDKIPPGLAELKKQRDSAEARVKTMELPSETRRAMECFLELHEADMKFLQGVVEALFKRHLRGYHARE